MLYQSPAYHHHPAICEHKRPPHLPDRSLPGENQVVTLQTSNHLRRQYQNKKINCIRKNFFLNCEMSQKLDSFFKASLKISYCLDFPTHWGLFFKFFANGKLGHMAHDGSLEGHCPLLPLLGYLDGRAGFGCSLPCNPWQSYSC